MINFSLSHTPPLTSGVADGDKFEDEVDSVVVVVVIASIAGFQRLAFKSFRLQESQAQGLR